MNKLLHVGLIWEVMYPKWLIYIVMMKKSNENWKIYVDFTDLNKEWLKDNFSLPKIDMLETLWAGLDF